MSGPPNFDAAAAPLTRSGTTDKIGSPTPRVAALTGVRPAAGFPVNVPDLPDRRMP